MKKLLLAAFVTLVIFSCGTPIIRPTLESAGGDPAVLRKLERGRELYISKCSACHALHPVEEYSSDEWASNVSEMEGLKKLKLDDSDREALLNYLATFGKRN